MSAKSSAILAVGRRKTASARIRLSRGTGSIVVNGKPVEEYLYPCLLHPSDAAHDLKHLYHTLSWTL